MLTNLFRCFHQPIIMTPKIWLATTPIVASASVVFKSAVPPRKKGTKAFSSCSDTIMPTEPMPGKMPSQLLMRIKKKKAMTKGASWVDFSREPVTLSNKPRNSSIMLSKKFCRPVGTMVIFFLIARAKATTIMTVNQEFKSELVIVKVPRCAIGSEYRVCSCFISSWFSVIVLFFFAKFLIFSLSNDH